jgi:hypothetical protein
VLQIPSGDSTPAALADFLSSQAANESAVFVAETVATGALRAVAAVSTGVETAALFEAFDMVPYDGLMASERFEATLAAARDNVVAVKQQQAFEVRTTCMALPIAHRPSLQTLAAQFALRPWRRCMFGSALR